MNTTQLYNPTPEELKTLPLDPVTRSLHSEGRAVLDLRGVTLTANPQNPPDVADPDTLDVWHALCKHDIRLARQTADQRRRRLYVTAAIYSASVYMCHDGGRYYLATLPTETDAKAFTAELAAVYSAHRVPLRVDL